ncbi:hypothetical protein SISSUDRAFT_1129862 [Sistotremastrum suecicum HHB10207 ss-3]|uniref:Transmembrane protein n=1 Tax=Sistotremastrum suecicum HHB10207 ss-3 TaxID=1314776 RepID=A0A166C706_9AGAM|nr:hypothetical protein SISSUDRAFT_1129862 [Sistotremastrum suecicum HHB10207 ss-3]
MPAPAVYIVGVGVVIAGVATAYVVKQHVWEPHIAPTIDRWAHALKAQREEMKRRRRDRMVRMTSSGTGIPIPPETPDAHELSSIASKDSSVVATAVDEAHDGLRQRRPAPSTPDQLSNSNPSLAFIPMSPTHVVSNRSDPSTPSTIRSSSAVPQELPGPSTFASERFLVPVLPLSPASSKLSDDLPTVGIQPESPAHQARSPFADPVDPTISHSISDLDFHSPRSELLSISGRESPSHSDDLSVDDDHSVIASDIGSLSASEISSWASVGSQRH